MEKYHSFFKSVKDFLNKVEIHKRRGNNDFNPYLEMWSESNEVKLHSSLIYGFLNPQNTHYQGDVFLETFLKCVELKEWFGNTSDARVYREYENIDMYITNGEKHIIVENKINAGDQDRQIERYIETIAKEQSQDSNDETESNKIEDKSYENIAVLYLTLDSTNPTPQSLGKWQIQGDYLTDSEGNKVRFKAISYRDEILSWIENSQAKVGCITNLNAKWQIQGDYLTDSEGNKVRFKAISYRDEILSWIENSQAKVGCITNLNAALLFYKDAVQIITNTKENTMSVEKFLTQGNMQENMEIVFEILKNHESILDRYYNEIISKYKKEIEDNGFEVVKANIGDKNDDWGWSGIWYPYIIKPKDCGKNYIGFGIQCEKKRYISYTLCVRLFGKYTDCQKYRTEYNKITEYLGIEMNGWWLKDRQKKRYISYTLCVRLFGKYTDCQKYRTEYNKITEYLGIEMNGWWLKDRHTDEIEMLDDELKKFLDSINEIKALNEKLKSYQG